MAGQGKGRQGHTMGRALVRIVRVIAADGVAAGGEGHQGGRQGNGPLRARHPFQARIAQQAQGQAGIDARPQVRVRIAAAFQ